jgi:hypothetical protein
LAGGGLQLSDVLTVNARFTFGQEFVVVFFIN